MLFNISQYYCLIKSITGRHAKSSLKKKSSFS